MNNVYVISVDGDGFDIEVYYIEEETSTMIRARKSKDSLLLVNKDRHEKYRVVSGMRLFFDEDIENDKIEEIIPQLIKEL